MDPNAEVYNRKKVVEHYASYSAVLQPAEETILNLIAPLLPGMNVLDVGVGAGRTTPYLASHAASYSAIDVSDGMIRAAKARWQRKFAQATFRVGDVCDLSYFENNSFDLVFFSFNGLDTLAHHQRERALLEMKRVLKTGGYLAFSSHNILHLPEFFRLRFRWNLYKLFRVLLKRKQLLKINKEQIGRLKSAEHLVVYDDVYDFGLQTYYVRPAAQVAELQKKSFNHIRLYDLAGKCLDAQRVEHVTDPWIYYLCQND